MGPIISGSPERGALFEIGNAPQPLSSYGTLQQDAHHLIPVIHKALTVVVVERCGRGRHDEAQPAELSEGGAVASRSGIRARCAGGDGEVVALAIHAAWIRRITSAQVLADTVIRCPKAKNPYKNRRKRDALTR